MTNFKDSPNIFKSELWRSGLRENPLIKTRCQNLFDFASYEAIVKHRYEMMRLYKPSNQKSDKNYEINIIEKGKFLKTIESNIPFYEKHFKEYQNKQYDLMKEKRLLYKKLKKKLFTWRGV